MTTIGIIGCGFVGTHLIDTFSTKFVTYGFDISVSRLNVLKQQYQNNTNVHLRSIFDDLNKCDLICICVPTPVQNNRLNDTYLRSAVETVQLFIRDEPRVTIVIESSVSIGLTRLLMTPLHDQGHFVGMSPERVSPGEMDVLARNIPKIVSGFDSNSLNSIINVYSQVFDTVVPVSSIETAEMCKLYENCFRMINIAYVNEICDACMKHGIDPNEMIQASSTKGFGFMPFYPSLYVGGSCIPNNSVVLLEKCENLTVLKAASVSNEQRPVTKAEEICTKYPNSTNFLIVGLGFKIGQSLTENSPGLKLANVLKTIHSKKVYVLDPLVEKQTEFDNGDIHGDEWKYDIVVITIKQKHIDFDTLYNKCEQHDTPIISYSS